MIHCGRVGLCPSLAVICALAEAKEGAGRERDGRLGGLLKIKLLPDLWMIMEEAIFHKRKG